MIGGRSVQIDRNALALMQHHRAQIVDAMGLVGVLMGQKHRVDVIDIGVDQLLAQIGRGIDHDPGDAALARSRSASSEQRRRRFFGLVGIAGAPAQRRTRHAGRGSAAEDGQRQRHAAAFGAGTLLNSRKKFSVVCARNLLQRNAARLRQHFGGLDHVGRLVALAAKLAGREIRRVGFDHDAIGRKLGGEIAQGLRLLEGQDARERNRQPERDRLHREIASAGVAMQHGAERALGHLVFEDAAAVPRRRRGYGSPAAGRSRAPRRCGRESRAPALRGEPLS